MLVGCFEVKGGLDWYMVVERVQLSYGREARLCRNVGNIDTMDMQRGPVLCMGGLMCSKGQQRLICAATSVDPDVRGEKPLAAELAAYGASHCSYYSHCSL
jgi:hypothetical protein